MRTLATALILSLAALAPSPLPAQAKGHLNVAAKAMTRIEFAMVSDGGSSLPYWFERRGGSVASLPGTDFPVTEKTLVITDLDYLIETGAAPAFTATLAPIRIVQTGTPATYMILDTVRTTLTSAGQEVIHRSFTSGTAVPPGFSLRFVAPNASWPQSVVRISLQGYYLD
jgi:hypothetical protein